MATGIFRNVEALHVSALSVTLNATGSWKLRVTNLKTHGALDVKSFSALF